MDEQTNGQPKITYDPNGQPITSAPAPVDIQANTPVGEAIPDAAPIPQPMAQELVQPNAQPVAPEPITPEAPVSTNQEVFQTPQGEAPTVVPVPNKFLAFFTSLDLRKVILAIIVVAAVGGGVYYLATSQNNNTLSGTKTNNNSNNTNLNSTISNSNINDNDNTNAEEVTYPGAYEPVNDFPIPATNSNLNTNATNTNTNQATVAVPATTWKVLDSSLSLTKAAAATRIGQSTGIVYPVSVAFISNTAEIVTLSITNSKDATCNQSAFTVTTSKEYVCGQYRYLIDLLSIDSINQIIKLRISQNE